MQRSETDTPTAPMKEGLPLNEYHRLVAEHVADILCVHDLEGNFEFVSPSVEKIVGYSPEELAGRSAYAFIHEEDIEREVRPAHEKLLKFRSDSFRCRFRHKNGRYVWLEVTNDFVLTETGQLWKLITSSRDITLRKSLEDRIRMFENIVEVATDSVLVTDTEQRIIYANPVFEKYTGYSFDEIRGKRPGEFLQGPDSDPGEIDRIRACVRDRRIETFELKNYKKSGEPFFVRMLIQPLFDRQGKHEGFFALQQDITKEREHRDEMEALNDTLRTKNEKLEKLNKDLEEFAYIASHDLKEPLRNVIGLLQLLGESASGKINEEETEFLEIARNSSDRLCRMIESLLDYSRTGYPTEDVDQIRVRDVLDTIKKDYSKFFSLKDATLRFHGGDVTIAAYPTAFHRLMQNLISNSLKHNGDRKPVIDVNVSDQRDHWVVTVRDDGPGIPEADQEKIFKLFNRLSSNSDNNGIGLALCKRIAELHQGSIDVSSTPNSGSTFCVTISKEIHENS